MINNFRTTTNYVPRRQQYEGADYIVVPVVMMVEGVHNGSRGPILHLAEDLGHVPDSWNGIPVTISHPAISGTYVSANSPDILHEWAVGRIFNAHMDGKKLKAEVWVEVNRLTDISPDALIAIEEGRVMEVSVGVFSDEEMTEGDYNGEHYTAIARNHRPDHLALLPDEVGACSVVDGCGIRVNNEKKGGTNVPDVKKDFIIQTMKSLQTQGYSPSMIVCQQGFEERLSKARSKLDSMDTEQKVYFLEELYEGFLVYRVRERQNEDVSIFRQPYQVNADGNIELVGDAVKVRRVVEYSPIGVNAEDEKDDKSNSGMKRTKFNNNSNKEEDVSMPDDKKCTPCVKVAVDGLISNAKAPYSEDDREWMQGLTEEQLKKLEPVVVNKVETKEKEISDEKVLAAMKRSITTPESFLEFAPAEYREVFKSGLALHQERRTSLVEGIMANTGEGVWTKEELDAMELGHLEKLGKSVIKSKEPVDLGDYSLFGAGNHSTKRIVPKGPQPMAPIGVNFENKEK